MFLISPIMSNFFLDETFISLAKSKVPNRNQANKETKQANMTVIRIKEKLHKNREINPLQIKQILEQNTANKTQSEIIKIVQILEHYSKYDGDACMRSRSRSRRRNMLHSLLARGRNTRHFPFVLRHRKEKFQYQANTS